MKGITGALIFIISLLQIRLSIAACYAPDGTNRTSGSDSKYAPCISIAGVESMCCRLNATNPDTCLASGLCYSPLNGNGGYWRVFCTDPTWSSPNCLQGICDNPDAGGSADGSTRVTSCGNGQWCCGETTACCARGVTFTLEDNLVKFASASSTSPSSSPTATATVTVTPAPAASGSDSDSTKIAIGVGVGVPLAFIALGMLGAGFIWGRRNTRKAMLQTWQGPAPVAIGDGADSRKNRVASQGLYPRELHAQEASETGGELRPAELGAHR